jgi:F-type H+-transporting ATPase subunit a
MSDFYFVSSELLAAGGVSFVGTFSYVILTLGILFGLLNYAKQGLNQRVFKNPLTSCGEQLFLFIENMCVGTIGAHGRKYVPMMMTFWLVIFVSNVISLFMPTAPTAIMGFNLGMALISIGYVQYEGIKANGVVGHFSHFAGPKLTGLLAVISFMLFFIELFSEIMKNISLSLRLWANMSGGHQAVLEMNKLGEHLLGLPFSIPFGAFLLPIKVLTCVIQAMIFTLLSCVYLSLVTHHDDHGDEHGHDHAPAHA